INISRKVVKLLAGNGIPGMVNGEAENAQFNNPVELTVDHNNGIVYIVDYANNSIRKIYPKKDQEITKVEPFKPDPQNPNQNNPVIIHNKPKVIEVLLQGTIKDKKTGKPIETSLLIENNQKKEVLKAYTEKGHYSVDLSPGEYKIAVTLDDYLPFSDLIDANLKESGTITYNIELERIEVGAKVIANNITFAQSSANLNQSSYPALFRIADFLKKHPNIKMSIEGHTDIGKDPQYNLWLSEERAKAVRDYLIQLGVKPENLTTKGWGNTKPIADNSTPEGRKLNRRTEFVIISE
ncbi:MAG: OmpA family protein, partial [Bacteroidia bacterium]|nr:OmpA family protein [Bacteroidia bacterium]